MINDNVQKFTVALVDEKYPDMDNEEFIYDLTNVEGKLIITKPDFNDTIIEDDCLIWVNEYTRYEIVSMDDLKQAMSKKKIVKNEEDDDGVIISLLTEEAPFMELFGEEDIRELFYRDVYYYVKKGKAKKVKARDFYEKYLSF